MSLDLKQEARPLGGIDELVEQLHSAERPVDQHALGLEHEKLVYPVESAVPVAYEGERGIGALLSSLAKVGGYQEFRETPQSPVIALTRGKAAVSLEPGGQFELSGTPFKTAREAHAENVAHVDEVKRAAAPLQLRLVGLGYRPFAILSKMPWMPKSRYKVMRESLGPRGSLALDMMLMTATGQVSLDWESEADCVRKTVVSARMTPLLISLYANSPLREGKPSGLMSFRARVWRDVDNARCGYLPSWFDGSFSYRAYVDWALDVPLLFLRRHGEYLRPKLTFRQLLSDGFEGKPAMASDWVDHLSTLFPEVRLKKVMEIRGADCGSVAMTGALPALMRGVLYDATALGEVEQLLPAVSLAQQLEFHDEAIARGMEGTWQKRPLFELSRELVAIAERGLKRLDAADAPLLEPLKQVAADGKSPARRVLEAFERNPDPSAVLGAFAL